MKLKDVHTGVPNTHQAVTAAKAERATDLLQSIVQDERFQWLVADCETNFSEKFRDFCSGGLQILASELMRALPSLHDRSDLLWLTLSPSGSGFDSSCHASHQGPFVALIT